MYETKRVKKGEKACNKKKICKYRKQLDVIMHNGKTSKFINSWFCCTDDKSYNQNIKNKF